MSENIKETKQRIRKIVRKLKAEFPGARCALNHTSPFELLIATILSAQCTDERVNKVTRILFTKYRAPEDYLAVPAEQLEQDIHATGFFRNKARSIRNCCAALLERHNGEVPRTMEELVKLAGVGRKTANVLLGNCFDTPAIVVDTHVKRISNLLDLTGQQNPDKIEIDLMDRVPQQDWTLFSHLIILHGRKTCVARRPACGSCSIKNLCPSARI